MPTPLSQYVPLPHPIVDAQGRVTRPWALFFNTLIGDVSIIINGGGGGGGGTVTVTGSPVAGNLTQFSGSTSITDGDLSGDVTTSGTLVVTIADGVVTLSKLQDISSPRVLGRSTAGLGPVEQLTISQALDGLP